MGGGGGERDKGWEGCGQMGNCKIRRVNQNKMQWLPSMQYQADRLVTD